MVELIRLLAGKEVYEKGEEPMGKFCQRSNHIDTRVREEASYIIENKSTIRAAAKVFGMSKSTIHKDVDDRLLYVDPLLWREVQEVLKNNWSERAQRGGAATRAKYATAKKE